MNMTAAIEALTGKALAESTDQEISGIMYADVYTGIRVYGSP